MSDGASAVERLIEVDDSVSGLHAFIAIDSTLRGPAFGGVRRLAYRSDEAARADALRLARAMTLKCALAGLPAGGGKSVIIDRAGLDLAAVYRAFGRAVDALEGTYVCGPDVGTGHEAIEWIRSQTTSVNAAGNDAGASTAQGVYAALKGALSVLDLDARSDTLRFAVQGLGAVGGALAARLAREGGEVFGADPDAGARERARAAGVHVVDVDEIGAMPVDVFMPCALGGVIDESRARSAPWRLVCGSANNQLASPEAGTLMHRRGVLWVPDFVASSGAVIEGVSTREGRTPAALELAARRIAAIEKTTRTVLEASRGGEAPLDVATRFARSHVHR